MDKIQRCGPCARNQKFIGDVFERILFPKEGSTTRRMLEIGGGTGEHWQYMTTRFGKDRLYWQSTDVSTDVLMQWKDEPIPLELDCKNEKQWNQFLDGNFNVAFTANTFHIMDWDGVVCCLNGVSKILKSKDSKFMVYGPFKYNGEFTTESNKKFNDGWLKTTYPEGGIRDFEAVLEVMNKNGWILQEDVKMPANNQLLIFQRPL